MSDDRPNIVFIMSDDHAAHAMSCYSGRINQTPHLDRIAKEGMRLDACFCTNSICTPSRATILTGTYSHVNGCTTLATHWDNTQDCYPKRLQAGGYQTAIFGKWHLGTGPEHCPTGFDDWKVLPGQGEYHDPEFIEKGPDGGTRKTYTGYVTDRITDFSIDWLKNRDRDRPFAMMVHHKAPHRKWEPDDKHAAMYEDEDIPLPETFDDDHSGHATAAQVAKMRMEDLQDKDLKQPVPEGLSPERERHWRYQRYIKDYLRTVASIDDNTGRLLDYLDAEGLTENTLVIYTSDQGFFLGDHNWFDKRFMYEESLKMPFVVRYPREIAPGTTSRDMVLNHDFASTFLDYAGLDIPEAWQGRSARPVFQGKPPENWRTSMYYRYWMHGEQAHNTTAHYGLRTHRYKLIYYYADPLGQYGAQERQTPREWELFDLEKDPREIKSVYHDPAYAETVKELKALLGKEQLAVGDEPYSLED
jgi:arylsulfatase A-like enzyme